MRSDLTPAGLASERGAVLISALFVLFALSILGVMTVKQSDTEMTIAGNKSRKTRAFLAAEAGLARADYIMNSNPWQLAADTLTLWINSDSTLPNAHFHVSMDTSLPRRRVIALGYSEPGLAGIQVTYEHRPNPRSIWSNALFAGHGNDGLSIKGKVGVAGSVHIMGDGEPYTDIDGNGVHDAGEPFEDANHDGAYDAPLAPDSMALDMTGSTVLKNNYGTLPAMLAGRLPALGTTPFGGEIVRSLHSELRVWHGNVGLSGNAKVGQPNQTGGTPAVKEPFDAVYVSDGFTGGLASDGVYSDNGWASAYDLERNPPDMPNLDLPYVDAQGNSYPSYMAYLKANALVIPGDLNLKASQALPLQASGNGSIAMDGSGNLQASGVIYVEGDINIQSGGSILYDGRFTLVSEGSITVDADLITKGTFATDDVVGLVTPHRVQLGSNASLLTVMGAVFAQEDLISSKKADVAGSLVANHFGATEIPNIYQVPALSDNLPPRLPGTDAVPAKTWRIVPRTWVELN